MDLNVQGSVVQPLNMKMVEGGPLTEASFPLLLLALAVWYLEHLRRTAAAEQQPASAARGFFQMLRRFTPEFVCLGALALFAVSALARGGNNNEVAMQQESDHKLWEHMQNQWGLLRTPDTFVALQAMLRVALLAAAIFRGAEADASPLMGESIHLFFMAAAGRMAMLVLAPVGPLLLLPGLPQLPRLLEALGQGLRAGLRHPSRARGLGGVEQPLGSCWSGIEAPRRAQLLQRVG